MYSVLREGGGNGSFFRSFFGRDSWELPFFPSEFVCFMRVQKRQVCRISARDSPRAFLFHGTDRWCSKRSGKRSSIRGTRTTE